MRNEVVLKFTKRWRFTSVFKLVHYVVNRCQGSKRKKKNFNSFFFVLVSVFTVC